MNSLVMKLLLSPLMAFASVHGPAAPPLGKQLCAEFRDCIHLNAESTTKCLKDALLNVGLTKKRIDGGQARTMGPSLITAGFHSFGPQSSKVPDGSVLIVQPREGCASDTGTILMKCEGQWVKNRRVAVRSNCSRKVFVHPNLQ